MLIFFNSRIMPGNFFFYASRLDITGSYSFCVGDQKTQRKAQGIPFQKVSQPESKENEILLRNTHEYIKSVGSGF